jgi:pimeloyl-ACP methyl ester carboxylesterase
VLLNAHLWRHQLRELSDIRRCIAPDLLAHGDTEIAADQDVSATANAEMLGQFLDALHIGQVDLVGNDSGGGIAQIFAARHPHRVRTLTLTNCDAHDNWPPEAFKPFLAMAAGGGLRGALSAMVGDKDLTLLRHWGRRMNARSPSPTPRSIAIHPHLRTAQERAISKALLARSTRRIRSPSAASSSSGAGTHRLGDRRRTST